jgi:hypothetical protein
VKKSDETNRELVARLNDLAGKWMQGCKTNDDIKDMIVKEQLINTLPGEIRVYVKEHKPKTSQEAGELADDHIRARKSGDGKLPKDIPPIRCSRCKKLGHSEKTSRVNLKSGDASPAYLPPAPPDEKPKLRTDLKYITCFNCQQKGHYSSNYPQSALFCGTGTGQTARQGQVEGKEVGDILLDTGCLRTMVHRDLVRDGKQLAELLREMAAAAKKSEATASCFDNRRQARSTFST